MSSPMPSLVVGICFPSSGSATPGKKKCASPSFLANRKPWWGEKNLVISAADPHGGENLRLRVYVTSAKGLPGASRASPLPSMREPLQCKAGPEYYVAEYKVAFVATKLT